MGPPRKNDQPVSDFYVIQNLTRGSALAAIRSHCVKRHKIGRSPGETPLFCR